MLKRSKRDGKSTQNCTEKIEMKELDYYDGVVSHPEPDILESKVKWALGSTLLLKLLNATEFQLNYSKP